MKPLEDLTVLDLTLALSGPVATLLLGGLGARVIKIENPSSGDTCRTNAPYLGVNGASLTRQNPDDISISALNRLRNKLGITLDLKRPESRDIFADLLRKADVVVENFTYGTMEKLGVGYQFACAINPRIVYCSITGFGQQGEVGGGKAMDTMIQGLSGLMYTSGSPSDPPIRVGVPMADLTAPLFGVIGVLSAIHQAQRTGLGQHVDISMLGALTMMVANEPFDTLESLGQASRTGQTMPRLAPFGVYPSRDGFVSICAFTEVFAHSLFRAMGRPELQTDPRFATRDARVLHVGALDPMIETFTRSLPTAQLVAHLEQHGVPVAEVRTPAQAVRDPRVTRRGETVALEHPVYGPTADVRGAGIPIRFSASEAGLDQPAPAMGQHNDEVYGGLLGYEADRIATLRKRGII